MTPTHLAVANTLFSNTELNQDIYWHQISMFASTANKYLACPENKLAAAWQNHTVSVERSFSASFRRGFLSEHVFELFDCTAQPSWQDHTTRLRDIILWANTPTDEYMSAFLRNHRRSSHHQLLNYNSADDALRRSAGGCQESRQLPTSEEWRPYLHQKTLFKPFPADKAGGRAHFSVKTSNLVAVYGLNVCDC